ncbi:FUSC family protein [Georgenia alba]|uniref:Aromatic acid exporter family protein n=1 Tax=Georgenia alba TaxID=2233858 RepID=A0ABW2QE54_9MICO
MRGTWRRGRVLLALRVRQGGRRVAEAFLPILTAAVAAAVAYFVSRHLLGHELPMFAPIAAWVCLGFSPDRQPRRVAELGAGATIGVALGEVLLGVVGSGAVQIAVVLLIAASVARFLDRGHLLTMQAGVQAVVIIAMPAAMIADGAVGRWADALVGAAIALLVAALLPGDLTRRPRRMTAAIVRDLASALGTLAQGLRTGDAQLAEDALAQLRGTQAALDSLDETLRSAQEVVAVNPALRKLRGTVAELSRTGMLADRAIRNARVVARRTVGAIEDGGASPQVGAEVDTIAVGLHALAGAIGAGDPPQHARSTLVRISADLVPVTHAEEGWRKQTLVSLLRSLVVDALQMTGMSSREAMSQMPEG